MKKAAVDIYQKRGLQYDVWMKQAKDLFLLRNSEYGDAIRSTGVLGATVELIGVVARLRQVVLLGSIPMGLRLRKVLRDKLIDGINYCIIGLIMLEEDNMKGAE